MRKAVLAMPTSGMPFCTLTLRLACDRSIAKVMKGEQIGVQIGSYKGPLTEHQLRKLASQLMMLEGVMGNTHPQVCTGLLHRV